VIGQDLHLAYIDPGAGSILVQVLIGSVLTVPYLLRKQLTRAYQLLRQRKPPAAPVAGSEPVTPDS
jgi:hypothetical protein